MRLALSVSISVDPETECAIVFYYARRFHVRHQHRLLATRVAVVDSETQRASEISRNHNCAHCEGLYKTSGYDVKNRNDNASVYLHTVEVAYFSKERLILSGFFFRSFRSLSKQLDLPARFMLQILFQGKELECSKIRL